MVAVFALVTLALGAVSTSAAPNRQAKRSDGAPRLMIRPVPGSGCPPGTFECGDKWCAPQRGQCCDWGACATGWTCSGEDTCSIDTQSAAAEPSKKSRPMASGWSKFVAPTRTKAQYTGSARPSRTGSKRPRRTGSKRPRRTDSDWY